MSTDPAKIDQVLKFLKDESERNDGRFSELRDSVRDVKSELKQDIKELKQEINKVYTSLSEDIQVFAEDHAQLKRRVDRIERKIA